MFMKVTKENIVAKAARKEFRSYTQYALSQTDYKKLLRACGTLEEELMIKIGVRLGLRRRDLSKILIADIDLEERSLTFFEHKKNRHRTLPLTTDLAQLISKHLHTLPKDRVYLFKWGKSEHGDFTAWRKLNALCDRAGIARRPFHALRGTAYKFAKQQGWSAEQAAHLLGDTVQTAMMHYGKPSPGEMRDLMDAMEEEE